MHTDIVIIGTGTAGMAAYRQAKAHTDKVLLLEQAEYGTTCARVGCMPSKLLIAAAQRAHQAHTSAAFGVVNQTHIDGQKVMQRIQAERNRFVGFVQQSVANFDEADKLIGTGVFSGENQLALYQGQEKIQDIHFKAAIIATGSRAVYPDFFKQAQDRLVINDDIFNWQDLPQSVAVFGLGVIGLELGQALSQLGVKVFMFGVGGGFGPFSDEHIKAQAHKLFASEFAHLDADAKVTHIQRSAQGVKIEYQQAGQSQQIEVDYLLAATGRKPNIDGIGLENLNIELDERAVPVANHRTLRLGKSAVFIAGDASNQLPLLHEAADQGRIAGDNAGRLINHKPLKAGLRHVPMGIVFTHPQLVTVGKSYQQLMLRCDSGCIAIGEVSFADQGRARVMGQNQGLLRLYAEQGTGLLLGAEMLAPAGEHLAHLLAWALQMQMSVAQMLEMPFYHPAIEEGLRTALRDALEQLEQGQAIGDQCCDCGVGA